MGDPTDKDERCNGCYYEGQSYMAYPCDQCTRAYSGMQKDYYKTVEEVDGLPLYINNSWWPKESVDISVDPAKELAEAHWGYVESLLTAHQVKAELIDNAKFHYISAFVHGYKHAVEDMTDERA